MFKRFWFALWSSSLLLLLAACGEATGAHSVNTSPTTQTSGPVSIATDHSVYRPSDHVQVTVLNKLSIPIYALDTRASCSILSLEVQVNGTWQASPAARCPLGRPAMIVKIDAGKAYTTTIQAGSPIGKDVAFPAGTYRLLLNYSTTASTTAILSNSTTVYSMTFSITGPTPTSPAGSGTPTSPRVVPPPPTP